MNAKEIAKLYANVTAYGMRPPQAFSDLTLKLYLEDLKDVSFEEAMNAFRVLRTQPNVYWLTPAHILDHLRNLKGQNSGELLLRKIQEWLQVDSKWQIYWDEYELSYGTDRGDGMQLPPPRPELDLLLLEVIDNFGGPQELKRKLDANDTTVRAQVRNALAAIVPALTAKGVSLEGTKAPMALSGADINAQGSETKTPVMPISNSTVEIA